MRQLKTFLHNSNQHISAHCDPDLGFHGVLAGAQKRLDAQMLFDPFLVPFSGEEQFYLPALPVQLRDQIGFEGKIVGQEGDARLPSSSCTTIRRSVAG